MKKRQEKHPSSRVRQVPHERAHMQQAHDPFVSADVEVPAVDEDDAAGSAQDAGGGGKAHHCHPREGAWQHACAGEPNAVHLHSALS